MHSLFSFGTYSVFEEVVPSLTRSLTVTVFTASTAWEKKISVRSFLFNLFWWICCFALWPIRLLLLLVSCVGSSCSVSYADWGRTARNHFETQAAPNKKRSYEQVHSMTSLALLAEFGKKWEDPVRRIWPAFFWARSVAKLLTEKHVCQKTLPSDSNSCDVQLVVCWLVVFLQRSLVRIVVQGVGGGFFPLFPFVLYTFSHSCPTFWTSQIRSFLFTLLNPVGREASEVSRLHLSWLSQKRDRVKFNIKIVCRMFSFCVIFNFLYTYRTG